MAPRAVTVATLICLVWLQLFQLTCALYVPVRAFGSRSNVITNRRSVGSLTRTTDHRANRRTTSVLFADPSGAMQKAKKKTVITRRREDSTTDSKKG
jgi:hypothetical protein